MTPAGLLFLLCPLSLQCLPAPITSQSHSQTSDRGWTRYQASTPPPMLSIKVIIVQEDRDEMFMFQRSHPLMCSLPRPPSGLR